MTPTTGFGFDGNGGSSAQSSDETILSYLSRGHVGIAITSPEKGFLEVNDELCRILGYSRAKLSEKTWAEITHPVDLPTDIAQFNRLLKGEMNGYTLDKRFIKDDGRVVTTTIMVQGLRATNGSVETVLGFVQEQSIVDLTRHPATATELSNVPSLVTLSLPEEREDILSRRKGFRPNLIPRWFRHKLVEANERCHWGLPKGNVSGWQLLQEFRFRFPSECAVFEHCGTYKGTFVSLPRMSISDAWARAMTLAEMLYVGVNVDGPASWLPGSVWVEWKPSSLDG